MVIHKVSKSKFSDSVVYRHEKKKKTRSIVSIRAESLSNEQEVDEPWEGCPSPIGAILSLHNINSKQSAAELRH